mmetsp:Transcript_24341/g.43263  ORF Transcript_24341/g.43263 Transcript_24341/m.43263 type:complete len:205 (+) Transcript_24341:177-791(+)
MLNVLLSDYTQRILSGSSLLVRIYGVFMLQCVENFSVDLMIMENITSRNSRPQFKLDLKGSTHDRCSKEQKPRIGQGKVFLKDVDFLKEVRSFDLEEPARTRLMEALEKDVAMLMSRGIMDYSLFGAYYDSQAVQAESKYCFHKRGKADCFYTLGLIDILQEYDTSKRCEHWVKRTMKRIAPEHLSTVDPQMYAERFLKFAESL